MCDKGGKTHSYFLRVSGSSSIPIPNICTRFVFLHTKRNNCDGAARHNDRGVLYPELKLGTVVTRLLLKRRTQQFHFFI